jgi:mRNA interferase RelE/StbE
MSGKNSVWSVEFSNSAKRELKRIDRHWQQRMLDYLESQIAVLPDPRIRGKALVGDKQGLWRYRIGDYRAICLLEEKQIVILVLHVGHRREVYR